MSKTKSVRISDDLAERIQEATEDGEHESAALRRLLRAGLDAEEKGPGRAISVTGAGVLMGVALFLLGNSPPVATITLPANIPTFWTALALLIGTPIASQKGWLAAVSSLFTTDAGESDPTDTDEQ
jgi:hypothetical protein